MLVNDKVSRLSDMSQLILATLQASLSFFSGDTATAGAVARNLVRLKRGRLWADATSWNANKQYVQDGLFSWQYVIHFDIFLGANSLLYRSISWVFLFNLYLKNRGLHWTNQKEKWTKLHIFDLIVDVLWSKLVIDLHLVCLEINYKVVKDCLNYFTF